MATEPEELEVDEVAEETEAFVTYDIASGSGAGAVSVDCGGFIELYQLARHSDPYRHARESGHPVTLKTLDSRFRGNDASGFVCVM